MQNNYRGNHYRDRPYADRRDRQDRPISDELPSNDVIKITRFIYSIFLIVTPLFRYGITAQTAVIATSLQGREIVQRVEIIENARMDH